MSAELRAIKIFLHERLKTQIVPADIYTPREILGFLVSFAVQMIRTPIIGGNWKMNTDLESGMNLASCIVDGVENCESCDVVVYPPFPYLQAVESVVSSSSVRLGSQNMSNEESGAFTGEVSALMLKDIGATSVLIGHSERRHVFGESDELISNKVSLGVEHGVQVVLCVGETLEEREAGNTLTVVLSQLRAGLSKVESSQMGTIVIAYEPVWAIGTGKTATPEDAQSVHASIRSTLDDMYDSSIAQQTRIQYGGSVKPENASDLFSCDDIDGALVGGASLSADSFIAIIMAAKNS
jgi:triosephosphate isomerase